MFMLEVRLIVVKLIFNSWYFSRLSHLCKIVKLDFFKSDTLFDKGCLGIVMGSTLACWFSDHMF